MSLFSFWLGSGVDDDEEDAEVFYNPDHAPKEEEKDVSEDVKSNSADAASPDTPSKQGGASAGANGDAQNIEVEAKRETTVRFKDEEEVDVEEEEGGEEDEVAPSLSKSTRLKGYITLSVASVISYSSAMESRTAQRSYSSPESASTVNGTSDDYSVLYSLVVVPATQEQQRYAMAAAMVSFIISIFCIFCHLDSYTCLAKYWKTKLFGPKATSFEMWLLIFMVVWWVVATWLNTSIRGIAGDGKGQFNLYFSTWVSCYASIWTLEKWVVAAGHSSYRAFMASWPHRAPGWIRLFVLSLSNMLCFLDLYFNWDDDQNQATDTGLTPDLVENIFANVSDSQWTWLIFVTAFTAPVALCFALAEVFRFTKPKNHPTDDDDNSDSDDGDQSPKASEDEGVKSPPSQNNLFRDKRDVHLSHSIEYGDDTNATLHELREAQYDLFPTPEEEDEDDTKKTDLENYIEGGVLFLLVIFWIPTVTVATIPGGAASLWGNAYFFTWACSIMVIDTCVWWIRDWRRSIHDAFQRQEDQYRRAKLEILQREEQKLRQRRQQVELAKLQQQQQERSAATSTGTLSAITYPLRALTSQDANDTTPQKRDLRIVTSPSSDGM
uniref:Uncharacterized protein n=1 Tax=Attheya septentrionalis TaxID=420275 RepID=A0A7S2UAY0_9STRA|mmetsp:Transcript_17952/g.32526  ORF Transcript_17952/g.32526 Transcript_17952/m.32526 type:complete len:608 (+) Transcript_17952:204-2027(+)|eukprot:CAMPEP_0198304964 /NCGR_PEP_ID=MMETSP1449-20131203/57661_1 /TAXON_ID=420275 /ORGANISM="Attheya septentrionalis, Strain CCMP2084" /LENGTH=607 /DNA_ID=CAMNT_0044007493 /DNA_START=147 /DNA_END=1970 /DNA_ORIENTATION=-